MEEKSSTGLKRETAGALAYVLFIFSGFMLLILEKDSFVRFHALQSIVFSIVSFAVYFVVRILFPPVSGLVVLSVFTLWLIFMYQAAAGKKWTLPVLGTTVVRLLSH